MNTYAVAWGQPCRAIIAKHGNPPDEPSEANCHVCQVEMRWGCHRLAVRVAPRPSGRLSRYNGEPTLNASGPHGPRGQLDGRHPPPRSRTCPAVSWASERAAIRFLRRRRAGRLPTNAAEPFSGLGHRLSRPRGIRARRHVIAAFDDDDGALVLPAAQQSRR
ncbi:hypothetical protein ACCO45_012909 [Purpureocillium lilacinum]|uniref:Uncharacterized protein n=1 Tax=Purpureocillium lilacinum TaxID=33203 RepID=A0ACC4D9C6_PURLI